MTKFRGPPYDRFVAAYAATEEHISSTPALAEAFESLQLFAGQILDSCFPSDFESLLKMWYFPIEEARLELEYSLFLAKAGVYKVAHMCLRNFLELSLVCFHYLLQARSKANAWVKGQVPTPVKKEVLRVLFDNPDFQHLDLAIRVKDRINRHYEELSDISHTRGRPCSHQGMGKANFPRLSKESLDSYMCRAKDVVGLVITCFVGVNPIILFPVPVEEKFGINGPLSGFLEECDVEILRKLLDPESLSQLLKYYETHPVVLSIRDWFESLPDITEEEFKRQIDDLDKSRREMETTNAKEVDPGKKQ